jgi:hypothetical protein
MTPKQHLAQQKSWVTAELMLSHPEMTRDEAAKIYETALTHLNSERGNVLIAAGRAC